MLALETKELVMDATFGTNNIGMDLFVVLAEVNRAGIPLAYCFVQTIPLENGTCYVDPGAITFVLDQFLCYL
jgi:hypothetical protein